MQGRPTGAGHDPVIWHVFGALPWARVPLIAWRMLPNPVACFEVQ